MSPRSWILRVSDIIERIDLIQEFINNKSKEEYLKDRKTQLATARCFSVIGEATNHIPDEVQHKYPNLEWRKLQDFKYLLFHEYFEVEQEMLWETSLRRLPEVKIKLQKVLDREFVG